jgi:5'-3' exonuclease
LRFTQHWHIQFIDLCILLGCDYLDPIKGIGPSTALKLIRDHKNLEGVVAHIQSDQKKLTVPDDWPFADARLLFLEPDVKPADDPECDFKWEAPDVEGLVKFLVEEKHFSEDRVRNGAAKLQKNMKSAQQSRLEGFFKPIEKTAEEKASLKRKAEEKLSEKKKKQKEDAKAKKQAKAKPKQAIWVRLANEETWNKDASMLALTGTRLSYNGVRVYPRSWPTRRFYGADEVVRIAALRPPMSEFTRVQAAELDFV